MKITLEFLGVLRRELARNTIEEFLDDLRGWTLRELLVYLLNKYPKLNLVVSSDGSLSSSYILFINGVDYMLLGGYDYRVRDGDVLTFIPISHGGSNTKDIKRVWGLLTNKLNSIKLEVYEISKDEASQIIKDLDKYQFRGCITQVLPKCLVISDKQLLLASLLTFKAIERNEMISKKQHIEFLIRLFSNRQINEVIKFIGRVNSEKYLLVTVCSEQEGRHKDVSFNYPKVNTEKLFNEFREDDIDYVIQVYNISDAVGRDVDRIHSIILSKIALFQLIT